MSEENISAYDKIRQLAMEWVKPVTEGGRGYMHCVIGELHTIRLALSDEAFNVVRHVTDEDTLNKFSFDTDEEFEKFFKECTRKFPDIILTVIHARDCVTR